MLEKGLMKVDAIRKKVGKNYLSDYQMKVDCGGLHPLGLDCRTLMVSF
jgi:hypothetical protein